MGRRGTDDDGIDLALIVRAPVVVDDFDLTPWAQVDARFGGELAVVFDRNHPAVWRDELGEHRRAIAGASADLHDPLAVLPVEGVEIARPKARQAVVKPARLIDRHKGVMIEPGRVIIGRHEWVVGTAWGASARVPSQGGALVGRRRFLHRQH